jgi:chemotaxis family two-component system response regulator Rcp1
MTGIAHLLLVEDNLADIRLIREVFSESRSKPEISVARDGLEAIELLTREWAAWRPTMILLDLNLPRKDGRQVLAFLKAERVTRGIPVVILSSSSAARDITSCYELGANCYIVKPIDLESFRKVVLTVEEFWLNTVELPLRIDCNPVAAASWL